MNASELIKHIQEVIDTFGDLPVCHTPYLPGHDMPIEKVNSRLIYNADDEDEPKGYYIKLGFE